VLIIKKLKYIVKLENDHLAYKEKYITSCIGIKFNKMKSVFGSVVAGAFQITFRAKMYANDFFHF
jgi:hypothetical protein